MLKTFTLLFVFLFLVSCGKSGSGGNKSTSGGQQAVLLEEISVNNAVPTAALHFNVNSHTSNFTATQDAKILEASEMIKRVVASEEFKNAILNFSYNGQSAFVDNKGLTNAQIYKIILEGAETLTPQIDNEMDLDLEVYKDNTIVIGYTMPNVNKIWMNEKYFDSYNSAQVTVNMMHEWLHKLGFDHAQTATPSRPYSVPYAIGYLMGQLAAKL